MNRLDQRFADLRAAGKKAFIAYIAAGDPTIERTIDVVLALEKCGVDVVELGVPFSDPVADGIVNQMAADRALKAGATTRKVLEMVREIRKVSQLPIVLFTYLNPVYAYGFKAFHTDAAAAGVDGILLLDLPTDEAVLNPETQLSPEDGEVPRSIRLIAPTTPSDRIQLIASAAQGFIYYVSREGVTGVQTELSTGIADQVQRIQAVASAPVAVGFGISTPEQARQVATMADGVVVGSAMVKLIGQYADSDQLIPELQAFVQPLVDAVKSV